MHSYIHIKSCKMNQSAEIKHQFSKTKICRHFLENRCTNKGNCNYAHVLEELRPLPNLENTKLCKSIKKKVPCLNPNCKYAHRIETLQPSTNLATYKTTLCYFWKKKKCMNQDKCRFAHGIEEIRPLRVPNEMKNVETQLPLTDRNDNSCVEKHQQKMKQKGQQKKELCTVYGKKWGKKWGPNEGKSKGKYEGNIWEENGRKYWNSEKHIARTDHTTEKNFNLLLEEETPQNVTTNLSLFDNTPTLENGLFQLNENFLNIYNRATSKVNAWPTSQKKTYSDAHEQNETNVKKESMENFILDMGFMNFDYLMDDTEVSNYDLFGDNSLDINLENLRNRNFGRRQSVSMSRSNVEDVDRSQNMDMGMSQGAYMNKGKCISMSRSQDIILDWSTQVSESNSLDIFLERHQNIGKIINTNHGVSKHHDRILHRCNSPTMGKSIGICNDQCNSENTESNEFFFSLNDISPEEVINDSELFTKLCKSIKGASKNFENICTY
ncbi:hypothetical protein, conserved [Plasmodium gonderi]|uniref:C3H1-type domain-containing protein n=1 Tax=Plasmodium gonderi TaxID=77519 RepID=A0A1Y1JDB3_PLAGO|nr:hypothetical protein, conserved [Plasmodium gonderi]GAW80509.1 hypothetical protein, conserved [Plasmodium gonderi]